MGLRANIFKSGIGSCSNGGLSSRVSDVTLVKVSGPWEPDDECPAALLVPGHVPGTARVVPAARIEGPGAAHEYHGEWAPLLSNEVRKIEEQPDLPLGIVLSSRDTAAIADALETLAGLDEGENTDYEDLMRLARIVREQTPAEIA